MAKDTLYLEENIEALLLTVSRAIEFHAANLSKCNCNVITNVQDNLQYRRSVIQSAHLQIVSMYKRAQNLINLVSSHDLFCRPT
jgi:hypothetical protein